MNISIALATHNGQAYLEQQLQSLLCQTLPPKEIIISDDGSTDGTCELLEGYARDHANIKVIYSDSKGINANFQSALSACRGDYIALCDQDDVWAKDKLAQLAAHCSDSVLLAYGKSILIDLEDRQLLESLEDYIGFGHYRSGHLPYYFFFSNCISGHAMIVRRELVDCALPFPANCLYDHWLALIASVKSNIVHVPAAITYHRLHAANAANNQERNKERKKRRVKRSKYDRYMDQRSVILLRLHKALGEGDALVSAERDYLSRLTNLITRAEGHIFNLQLFFLLFNKRHQLFHGNVLRECRNRALGGRYYKLLDSSVRAK